MRLRQLGKKRFEKKYKLHEPHPPQKINPMVPGYCGGAASPPCGPSARRGLHLPPLAAAPRTMGFIFCGGWSSCSLYIFSSNEQCNGKCRGQRERHLRGDDKVAAIGTLLLHIAAYLFENSAADVTIPCIVVSMPCIIECHSCICTLQRMGYIWCTRLWWRWTRK